MVSIYVGAIGAPPILSIESFHGTPPRDLPVEFPNQLLLSVNRKTADALGLAMPPTLIARADEVFE